MAKKKKTRRQATIFAMAARIFAAKKRKNAKTWRASIAKAAAKCEPPSDCKVPKGMEPGLENARKIKGTYYVKAKKRDGGYYLRKVKKRSVMRARARARKR